MIYKNVANQKLPLYVQDNNGSPVTGQASNITAYVSVDGGSAQQVTPVTEVGGGYYTITPSQAQTNGDLILWWGTHASYICRGGAAFTSRDYTAARAQALDNLDATISSRLASSSYSAPDNTSIAAIKAKTDLLSFSGNDVKATLDGETVTVSANQDKTGYSLTSAYDRAKDALKYTEYTAPDNNSITAIKNQTDKLLFSQNGSENYVVAILTLSCAQSVAGIVWSYETRSLTSNVTVGGYAQGVSPANEMEALGYTTDRATKLDNLDAAISTRLASSSYTTPDNASIAAIKEKTDQLSFDSGKVAAKISDPVSVSSSDISAIVDGVWDELISQHTTTGSAGAVLAAASDDGTSPGTIVCSPVVYPLQLSTAPRTSGPSITWYTGEKPAASFVIKSTDLTTKDVVLSVFALANPQEVLLEAAGSVAYSEATLTSTVNISLDELVLAPSFAYRYILKNVTDDTVLASGPLYVISVPA